jgi:hypothetical protein
VDDDKARLDAFFRNEAAIENLDQLQAGLVDKATLAFERNRKAMQDFERLRSEMLRIRFEALVGAGFSESQALIMLIQQGGHFDEAE